MTSDRMLMASNLAVDSKVFFDAATEALQTVSKLYDSQLAKLDSLIACASTAFKADKIYILGAMVVGVILAILLVALIARAILRQINHINDALAAINEGNYRARSKVTTQDELGHMAKS
jgi:methyl-accepting chemotaxis protein